MRVLGPQVYFMAIFYKCIGTARALVHPPKPVIFFWVCFGPWPWLCAVLPHLGSRNPFFYHGVPSFAGVAGVAVWHFWNPLPSAAPDPLAGHQELPQYYVEVETILCGLQMNQMSCIEQTLLQTMLKNKSIQTMLKMLRKKKSKKAGASIPRLLACFALKGIPRKNRRPHQPRVSCVG